MQVAGRRNIDSSIMFLKCRFVNSRWWLVKYGVSDMIGITWTRFTARCIGLFCFGRGANLSSLQGIALVLILCLIIIFKQIFSCNHLRSFLSSWSSYHQVKTEVSILLYSFLTQPLLFLLPVPVSEIFLLLSGWFILGNKQSTASFNIPTVPSNKSCCVLQRTTICWRSWWLLWYFSKSYWTLSVS